MTTAVRVETGGGVGGFDDQPADPALAAALEAVDPSTLPGEAAASWMRGAFRVRNHADWLLLLTIREACSSRAGTTTRGELDEFAPKIAAASLGWTAVTACSRLDLAAGVLERMPALGEAMRTGLLEVAKAAAFVTGLDGLSDTQARAVVEALLGEAGSMGMAELRQRILGAAYDVDQVWGAARLAAATARARVSAETAPSGAVDLCGRDLDPNLAQAAKLRLRALALAIRSRLRASGHKAGLGFIEARVFVRLMDGTQAGAASDAAVIDAVTAELAAHAQPTRNTEPAGSSCDQERTRGSRPPGPHSPESGADNDSGDDDDGDGDGGSRRDGPPRPRPTPDSGAETGDSQSRQPIPTGRPGEPRPSSGDSDPVPIDLTPAAADSDRTAPSRSDTDEQVSGSDGSRCVAFAPGVGVHLVLSTLLGLDDQPGSLPGIGPVPADAARTAAHIRGAATWKVLVHDEQGHLQHLLTLRAPPWAVHDPRFARQSVQIAAPAALLAALDPKAPGPDADGPDPLANARSTLLDGETTAWLARLREAHDRSKSADPDDHPATTTRERDRRFPGARLAEFVRARDQTCIRPGCNRPAEACDLDHTLDWLYGGRTEAGDLDTLCRHDHRAKHEGGWTYEQPEPGRFVITDPTGTRHHVDGRVVHPRPAPHTSGQALTPEPAHPAPREDWAPRRTRDGRITPEAEATAERLTRQARDQEGQPPSRYDHDPDF